MSNLIAAERDTILALSSSFVACYVVIAALGFTIRAVRKLRRDTYDTLRIAAIGASVSNVVVCMFFYIYIVKSNFRYPVIAFLIYSSFAQFPSVAVIGLCVLGQSFRENVDPRSKSLTVHLWAIVALITEIAFVLWFAAGLRRD